MMGKVGECGQKCAGGKKGKWKQTNLFPLSPYIFTVAIFNQEVSEVRW